MKYILLLIFTLISTFSYSQISLEVIGGVGFDIKKFETKYTNNRTPLTHSYTYDGNPNDVEFTILEPQNIGARFLWKFSKKMNLSVGLEGFYTKRDIIGTFYDKEYPDWSFPKMDIDIEYYTLGFVIRKEIKLNQKNSLFIQPSIYSMSYPGGTGYFSANEGIEKIDKRNYQLIQYREEEEYYNLIEIDGWGSILNYSFTQGYLINLTDNFKLGISSSVLFQTEEIGDFIIWAWNDDEQRKAGLWSPTALRFTSVMFDLFLTYEF